MTVFIFDRKRRHNLLSVGSKTHKRVNVGPCWPRDFSITVIPHYGNSYVIWDHTVYLPLDRGDIPTKVTAEGGTWFIDFYGIKFRVDVSRLMPTYISCSRAVVLKTFMHVHASTCRCDLNVIAKTIRNQPFM